MVGAIHVAPELQHHHQHHRRQFHQSTPAQAPASAPGESLNTRVHPYERWAHAEAVMAKATAVARRVVKTVPGKMAAGLSIGPTGPVPALPPRIPPRAMRSLKGTPRGQTPRRSMTSPRSTSAREKSPKTLQEEPSKTTQHTASSHTLAKSGADLEETTPARPRMRVPDYVPPPTTVLYASTLTQQRNPPPPTIRPPPSPRDQEKTHPVFSGTKEYFYAFPDIKKDPDVVLNSLEERSRRRDVVMSDLSSQEFLAPPPSKKTSNIPIARYAISSAPAVISHVTKPSSGPIRDPKEVLRNAYRHYINKAKNVRDAQGLMLDLAWREQERDGYRDRGSTELERLRRKLREPTVVDEDAISMETHPYSQKPLVSYYTIPNARRYPSDRSNESSQDSRIGRPSTYASAVERTPAKGALKLGRPKDSDLRISGRKKSVQIVTPPKTPLQASSSTMGIDSSLIQPPSPKRVMTPLKATPARYKTPPVRKEESVSHVPEKASRERSATNTPSDSLRPTVHKGTRHHTPSSQRSSRSNTRRSTPPRRSIPPPTTPPHPTLLVETSRPVTPRLVLPTNTTMRRTPHHTTTRARYNKIRPPTPIVTSQDALVGRTTPSKTSNVKNRGPLRGMTESARNRLIKTLTSS